MMFNHHHEWHPSQSDPFLSVHSYVTLHGNTIASMVSSKKFDADKIVPLSSHSFIILRINHIKEKYYCTYKISYIQMYIPQYYFIDHFPNLFLPKLHVKSEWVPRASMPCSIMSVMEWLGRLKRWPTAVSSLAVLTVHLCP